MKQALSLIASGMSVFSSISYDNQCPLCCLPRLATPVVGPVLGILNFTFKSGVSPEESKGEGT